MFNPRNIQDIQIGFFKYLAENGSALTDIAPGSVLHSLTRSFAGIHYEQDLVLNELSNSMFYSNAIGSDLDRLASNFNLLRRSGGVSTGFVLTLSSDPNVSIEPNTILTDTTTNLQFIVNLSFSVKILSFIEAKIPITAVQQGLQYNLKAGSKLISPSYPNVNFIVGTHRTNNGEVCGNIGFGASPESDDSFRSRIIEFISNRRGTTQQAIRAALLENNIIEEVFFKNTIPGLLEIYLDSPNILTQINFLEFSNIVNLIKAAGVTFTLFQAIRQNTDIQIYILPLPQVDKDTLTENILNITTRYLFSLSVGQLFSREALIKQIVSTGSVVQAQIITPTTDIQPPNNAVVRSNNIWITYDAL